MRALNQRQRPGAHDLRGAKRLDPDRIAWLLDVRGSQTLPFCRPAGSEIEFHFDSEGYICFSFPSLHLDERWRITALRDLPIATPLPSNQGIAAISPAPALTVNRLSGNHSSLNLLPSATPKHFRVERAPGSKAFAE